MNQPSPTHLDYAEEADSPSEARPGCRRRPFGNSRRTCCGPPHRTPRRTPTFMRSMKIGI